MVRTSRRLDRQIARNELMLYADQYLLLHPKTNETYEVKKVNSNGQRKRACIVKKGSVFITFRGETIAAVTAISGE